MPYYVILAEDYIHEEMIAYGPFGDDIVQVEQDADDLRRRYKGDPVSVRVVECKSL